MRTHDSYQCFANQTEPESAGSRWYRKILISPPHADLPLRSYGYRVHSLGSRARMLPETCRRPALLALSSLQVIILSCHGRRSYSVKEWNHLTIDSAMILFGCLQYLMEYKESQDTSKNPTTFTPMPRFICAPHILLTHLMIKYYGHI